MVQELLRTRRRSAQFALAAVLVLHRETLSTLHILDQFKSTKLGAMNV
jgi:hypothetical protein